MSLSRNTLIGTSMLVFVVAGVFWIRPAILGRTEAGVAAIPTKGAETKVQAPSLTDSPKAVADLVPGYARAPHGPSTALQHELVEAKDFRVFALAALQRPREGGYFYAKYVANLCSRGYSQVVGRHVEDNVRSKVAADGTVSSDYLERLNAIRLTCATFALGEAGDVVRQVEERSADHADPLINATRAADSAIRSQDTAAIRKALELLLDTGDMLAISEMSLLQRVMYSDAEAKAAHGMWFNGKLYTGQEYSDLLAALDLAQCSDGLPCRVDDMQMLSCVGRGLCVPDRHEWFAASMAQDDAAKERLAKIHDIEGQVRAAIVSRSVSAFVRP